jgi:hypothetical protein
VDGETISWCEALTSMQVVRAGTPCPQCTARGTALVCVFCAAVGGCVIFAGCIGSTRTAEECGEELGQWRWLPCGLPHANRLCWMGSVLI